MPTVRPARPAPRACRTRSEPLPRAARDYVNVYYSGGNLMKVSPMDSGYSAFFDQKYFEGAVSPISMPTSRLREPQDLLAWLSALPCLKQAMDSWLGRHPKDEREAQQQLLRDNNVGGQARETDFYVCDIECANDHGRFDLVAVHWPSTSVQRGARGGAPSHRCQEPNGTESYLGARR